MYDCIIIGAGPAGSTAAKILAEKGLKVLLVEKFKLPRHKSCSGILIKSRWIWSNSILERVRRCLRCALPHGTRA